ncbi:MAG: TonB-dependent receptor [Thermodesulfobacteriota bacterium]|nr:TonB-dependent receptor [Thermodesulfobacteriota bacterium]
MTSQDLLDLPLEDLMNIKVYSVSRREEQATKAPQVVTVITPAEMKRFGLRTIHDALAMVPGFDIQRQHRTERIWTRGLRESVLVLFDGIPIFDITDNQIHLDEAFQIENIERIEILRGPGGVTWGTNSFLGIVNIITKDPSQSPYLAVNVSYGSHNDKRIGVAASNTYGELGLFASGRFVHKKMHAIELDYWSDRGANDPSHYGDLFLKATYKKWGLQYRADSQENNSPTYDSRQYLMTDEPLSEEDPMSLALLKYDTELTENMDFHGKLAWMHRKFYLYIPKDPENESTTSTQIYDNFQHDTVTLDLQFNNHFSSKTKLTWGGNYMRGWSYDTRFITIPGDGSSQTDEFGQAEAKIDRYGLFGQVAHDVRGNWTLGAGVRLEFSDERYRNVEGGSFNSIDVDPQFLFNLNAVHEFDNGNVLKLIAAKGLRRPSVEQSSGRVAGFEGHYDIDEEVVYSYEADFAWLISKYFTWRNNYSYNDLHGLIDFRKGESESQEADNLSRAGIHCFESEVRVNFRNGSYGLANVTYKDGKTSDNEDFSIENTNKYNVNVAYSHHLGRGIYWSNVLRHVSSKRDNHQEDDGSPPVDEPSLKTVPAYTTWDTGLIWNDACLENLNASLFVYNVLDEESFHQNRITRTGYMDEQAGTTFILNLEYVF